MDIRVEPRDGITVEELHSLADTVRERFPETHDQTEVIGELKLDASGDQPATQTITPSKIGIRFSNQAKDKLFQAQIGGFAFNKLRPYTTWEEFRDEGRGLWNLYRDLAQPKRAIRVALRYINRLELPLPFDDFKKYLRTVPEIAPDLPQALSNFFMQLQIPQEDIGALLVLNMSFLPPEREGVCSMLLDLDVFRAGNVPQDENELWLYFEQLRLRKNKVFEACLTDEMKELFG